MLVDVERLAVTAICPCCQNKGNFSVRVNAQVQCESCQAIYIFESELITKMAVRGKRLECSLESNSCRIIDDLKDAA